MELITRFVRSYVRPFWFRMVMVMLMAGVTSSYSFILGFITKITVDNVLQIKPDVTVVEGRAAGSSTVGSTSSRTRDPHSVLPWKDPFQPHVHEKSRTEKIQWLWFIFFLYLAVRSTFAVINWFYNYHIAYVGQRIVFRIRLDLHQKIQKLQMTFFDGQQTGKIMSRVLDDVGLLQSEVTGTFVSTTRHVAQILLGSVILLTINVKLGLLALLAMPAYIVTYKMFQKAIQTAFLRQRETFADTYGILEERVRGIRVLLSFAKERSEYRRFFSRLVQIFRLTLRSMMLSSGLGATCSAISAIATAALFYLGALEVQNGNMSIGALIYFNMSMGNLFDPFVSLANVNATLQQMVVVISRVFEVLDEEVVISDRPNAVRLDSVKGRVVFRNVSFRYHEAGDEVLKDLSFRVRPRTVVGRRGAIGIRKEHACQPACCVSTNRLRGASSSTTMTFETFGFRRLESTSASCRRSPSSFPARLPKTSSTARTMQPRIRS